MIPVEDPFGVIDDAAMPTLSEALDPGAMQQRLLHDLPRLTRENTHRRLQAIRVTRHKPGKRCVIEYDILFEHRGAAAETATLIGKVRAGRTGRIGYRLLDALWRAGFAADSKDGVSVPQPLGVLPDLQIWLQRKVPGRVATELLVEPGATWLVERIAEAAHKLHCARVPAKRSHTMADELRILRERLAAVAQEQPRWAARIERLIEACERLGTALPPPVPCGIHRDFYPDQVIVDGVRLWLIDFDLYCTGDPGLDIGNFLGHITEHSLRTLGDPGALAPLEHAMAERFAALSGDVAGRAAATYATLTLVRHVYLSTLFAERRRYTGRILDLCEERLAGRTAKHAKALQPL